MSPLGNQPFTREGQGAAAALLVHGLGGGTYELQWLGEHLHARLGLTVRAMQLPGHAPARRMPRSTHEAWLSEVRREHEALRARFSVVHLVGFSTGSTLALRLAEQDELSGKLVLLSPLVDIYRPPFVPVRTERLLDVVPWLSQVPRRPPPLKDRAVRREVTRCLPFGTMNLHAARSARALVGQVLAELGRVRAPTLLLQGQRDTVVDPRGAERLDAGLTAPHRLVRFPVSDHLLALDAEREQVFDEACHFLS